MHHVFPHFVRLAVAATSVGAALTACASPPDEIPPTYVSASKFEKLDCAALEKALEKNAREAGDLRFKLQNTANVDTAQAAIGIVFLPTLLFLEGGDGKDAKTYAHLKGERAALVDAVHDKKCNIDLSRTDMVDPVCKDKKDGKCPPNLIRRVPDLN